MFKASQVLLLVGAIISFVVLPLFLIVGIIYLACSSPDLTKGIIEGINNGSITTNYNGTPEEQAAFIQLVFSIIGSIFLVLAFLNLANAIVSLAARNKQTKVSYIISIIFGFVSGIELNLVGGILGLVSLQRTMNSLNR